MGPKFWPPRGGGRGGRPVAVRGMAKSLFGALSGEAFNETPEPKPEVQPDSKDE